MNGYSTKKTRHEDGMANSMYIKKKGGEWRIFLKVENVPDHGTLNICIGKAWLYKEYWIAGFVDPYDEVHEIVCTQGFEKILFHVEANLQLLAEKDMARQDFLENIDFNNVDEILTSWE